MNLQFSTLFTLWPNKKIVSVKMTLGRRISQEKFEIIDQIKICCLALWAPTTNRILLDVDSCKWYYVQGTFMLGLPWSGMSIGFVPHKQWLTPSEILYLFFYLWYFDFVLQILRCHSSIKLIDNIYTTIHCFPTHRNVFFVLHSNQC